MKKVVCILVLTCVVMGGAFAQQKAAASAKKGTKNAVALDVFPLFDGIIASDSGEGYNYTYICFSTAYERLLVPHFSIGPNLDYFYLSWEHDAPVKDYKGYYFSIAVEGRYYPSADFDGVFVGTTLGFNQLSVDGKTEAKDGGFSGLIASLKMGYKVVIANIFYIEPALSYVLSKSSIYVDPSGLQGGLRLGFTF